MNLFPDLKRRYTCEQLSAREAQRQAEFIAWGPIVFQVARLMLKFGILNLLRDSDDGLTEAEVVEKT
ncbi:MAG: SAM-dependent methyltransferase, partial [Bacteroidaceae bacterium]|nr:SAM-dependent methyltransferase [Bacteroidaceae bacterium]